ncbi:MAG3240 family lipoprotein [Mycoplasmopsis columboralis]|uniref:Lipoprotein n=1 Tax=Mycoplasmopsis columboralis TaxID=171282 RepID=A0A449B776_9BACT|nr:hypothetical protein [Mycoplasmopsis columboralis]VEU76433.1 Uncharacterised protein [Mycoplasmopsis columboralis]
MKFKWFISVCLPAITPLMVVSCYQTNNKENKYLTELFDWTSNKNQLNYLLDNNMFFFQDDIHSNPKQNSDLLKQKNDSSIGLVNQNIEDFYSKNTIDLQELKTLFSKSYLKQIKANKFKSQEFIPNLQYALFDIYVNLDLFKNSIPNLIDLTDIRFIAFKQNIEQQNYWNKLMTFYLKAFDIPNFSQAYLNFHDDQTVSINLLDSENRPIYKNWEQIKFVLPDFKNYNRRKTWNRNFELEITDNEILFNEKFKDADFSLKSNPLLVSSFEDIIENSSILKKISIKGLFVLLNYLNKYIQITNDFKVNWEDTFSSLHDLPLKNSGIVAPLIVEKDNQKFKWYSIDFSKHKHVLNGFYIQNNLDFNKSFDFTLSKYDLFESENKMQIKSSLKLEEFINNNLQQILNYFIFQNKDNLNIWNGMKMSEFEPQQLENSFLEENPINWILLQVSVLINSYLFEYENQNGFTPMMLKLKSFNADNSQLGTLDIILDLVDLKRNKVIISNISSHLKGFKGYDYNKLKDFNPSEFKLNEYQESYK